MKGEIVSTVTEDWVRLHGFYVKSAVAPATTLDAAVITHGLAGNFYKSRLLTHLAEALLRLGISVVTINTRGHDYLNSTIRAGRGQPSGAGLENVSEAKFDLAGWANWLSELGYKNVLHLGHSLGAIKGLYAQANHPQPIVKAIVGLSATRLAHQQLLDSPRGDRFRHWYSCATQMVEAGQGDELMHVDYPFPTWMAARAYAQKYGPADEYNWLNFVDRITIPTLLVFGEKELAENPAFDGLDAELAELQKNFTALDVDRLAGADHFYSGMYDSVAETVSRWLPRA